MHSHFANVPHYNVYVVVDCVLFTSMLWMCFTLNIPADMSMSSWVLDILPVTVKTNATYVPECRTHWFVEQSRIFHCIDNLVGNCSLAVVAYPDSPDIV